jgi:hypothetical protein
MGASASGNGRNARGPCVAGVHQFIDAPPHVFFLFFLSIPLDPTPFTRLSSAGEHLPVGVIFNRPRADSTLPGILVTATLVSPLSAERFGRPPHF